MSEEEEGRNWFQSAVSKGEVIGDEVKEGAG